MSSLIESIRERDPAQPTFFEVVFSYPGFHAVMLHNISSWLWSKKLRALARFSAHIGRFLTGIEIHPGAKLGTNLFIDHGMGVVIGETVEIGDNVTLYHGVTLGGLSVTETGKRHPTLQDNVMVGAGAQVLGPITLGNGSRVGANAVVTKSVPENCTAVGNPARFISCEETSASYGLPYHSTPDPVGETISALLKDVKELKKQAGIKDENQDKKQHNNTHAEIWRGDSI
jgi:serine O-acetyltransferase